MAVDRIFFAAKLVVAFIRIARRANLPADEEEKWPIRLGLELSKKESYDLSRVNQREF